MTADAQHRIEWRGWTPVGRTNPKPTRRGCRLSLVQTPQTRAALRYLTLQARASWSGPPLEVPLAIHAVFVFAPPKSWPDWKRAAALAGDIPHATKPDASNLLKLLEDACTQAEVWRDDAQIVEATTLKRYGPTPGASLYIFERDPVPSTRADYTPQRSA